MLYAFIAFICLLLNIPIHFIKTIFKVSFKTNLIVFALISSWFYFFNQSKFVWTKKSLRKQLFVFKTICRSRYGFKSHKCLNIEYSNLLIDTGNIHLPLFHHEQDDPFLKHSKTLLLIILSQVLSILNKKLLWQYKLNPHCRYSCDYHYQ